MDAATSSFNLGTVLLASVVLFPLACLFFGTRGGYYNTDAAKMANVMRPSATLNAIIG